MPKRSVEAFRLKRVSPGHAWYSNVDIEAIIDAAGGLPEGDVEHFADNPNFATHGVPRRQALRDRLELAAHNYAVLSQFEIQPTAKQIADAMADIEAAAAKLIAALYLPEAMDQDPLASMPTALRGLQGWAVAEAKQLGKSGADLLGEAVYGVYRLHGWARNEAQASRRAVRQTPQAKRHAGNEELDNLFKELASIWTDVFERPIATTVGGPQSVNAGKAGGPMLRFLSACLKPILKDTTPNYEAIRGRIRRLFPSF